MHLPLYIGVLGLFVTAVWAASDPRRRAHAPLALPVIVAGATVQLAGEAWHAYSHLMFRPNPFPELAGFLGLVVVVGAMIVSGRPRAERHASAEPGPGRGHADRPPRARERMTR